MVPLAALTMVSAFLRTAWVADDAFISFRVLENLHAGAGLVWNLGERVQVFTHPLWLLLLALPTALTHEQFFTSLSVSALCVALFSLVMLRIADDRARAGLVLLVCALSRVFVDFSSSGLENPLSHLLLVLLLWIHQKGERTAREAECACLLAGLLIVNRLDLVLLGAPIAAHVVWRAHAASGWKRTAACVTVGMAPVLLWTIFALIYFGSPLPNTYFAKLGTGSTQAAQGLRYLEDFCSYDAPSALWILLGIAAGLAMPAQRAIAAGICLHLLYVVAIGGDFMSGRFLSAAFVAATVLLLRFEAVRRVHPLLITLLCAMFLLNLKTTVASPWSYSDRTVPDDGVVDERGFAYLDQGLWRNLAQPRWRMSAAARTAAAAQAVPGPQVMCFVGVAAYLAGAGMEVIDPLALTDPFLARLPARRPSRVGHYERPLPPGYLESRRSGRNVVADPQLASLWDDVHLVITAPLFDQRRWSAIWRSGTGAWDSMVERSEFARDASHFSAERRWYCY